MQSVPPLEGGMYSTSEQQHQQSMLGYQSVVRNYQLGKNKDDQFEDFNEDSEEDDDNDDILVNRRDIESTIQPGEGGRIIVGGGQPRQQGYARGNTGLIGVDTESSNGSGSLSVLRASGSGDALMNAQNLMLHPDSLGGLGPIRWGSTSSPGVNKTGLMSGMTTLAPGSGDISALTSALAGSQPLLNRSSHGNGQGSVLGCDPQNATTSNLASTVNSSTTTTTTTTTTGHGIGAGFAGSLLTTGRVSLGSLSQTAHVSHSYSMLDKSKVTVSPPTSFTTPRSSLGINPTSSSPLTTSPPSVGSLPIGFRNTSPLDSHAHHPLASSPSVTNSGSVLSIGPSTNYIPTTGDTFFTGSSSLVSRPSLPSLLSPIISNGGGNHHGNSNGLAGSLGPTSSHFSATALGGLSTTHASLSSSTSTSSTTVSHVLSSGGGGFASTLASFQPRTSFPLSTTNASPRNSLTSFPGIPASSSITSTNLPNNSSSTSTYHYPNLGLVTNNLNMTTTTSLASAGPLLSPMSVGSVNGNDSSQAHNSSHAIPPFTTSSSISLQMGVVVPPYGDAGLKISEGNSTPGMADSGTPAATIINNNSLIPPGSGSGSNGSGGNDGGMQNTLCNNGITLNSSTSGLTDFRRSTLRSSMNPTNTNPFVVSANSAFAPPPTMSSMTGTVTTNTNNSTVVGSMGVVNTRTSRSSRSNTSSPHTGPSRSPRLHPTLPTSTTTEISEIGNTPTRSSSSSASSSANLHSRFSQLNLGNPSPLSLPVVARSNHTSNKKGVGMPSDNSESQSVRLDRALLEGYEHYTPDIKRKQYFNALARHLEEFRIAGIKANDPKSPPHRFTYRAIDVTLPVGSSTISSTSGRTQVKRPIILSCENKPLNPVPCLTECTKPVPAMNEDGLDGTFVCGGLYTREERRRKIFRYKEKKATASFEKKIMYECRQKFASSRPRKGGKFLSKEEMAREEALAKQQQQPQQSQQQQQQSVPFTQPNNTKRQQVQGRGLTGYEFSAGSRLVKQEVRPPNSRGGRGGVVRRAPNSDDDDDELLDEDDDNISHDQ